MPHDVHGNLLKIGDRVLISCVVTHLDEGEEYCNVSLESEHGRRPDGLKEHFSGINTGVLALVLVGANGTPFTPTALGEPVALTSKKNVQERLADLEREVFGPRPLATYTKAEEKEFFGYVPTDTPEATP